MQQSVKSFIKTYQLQTDAQTRYIDLVSEVGELGKEIVKSTEYGKKPYAPTSSATDELGDCLFSLFALCYEMDVDAQAALEQALAKYEQRFAQKGYVGSGG
ncbi:MAG: MazG-like family protein [Oscillospiraceae bacterium]|nr:MazG-like family protein [Oscillospiraceae bacterium]